MLFFLKNGKRRSFPLARGHDGKGFKSKRRGRSSPPFPPLLSLLVAQRRPSGRERNTGAVLIESKRFWCPRPLIPLVTLAEIFNTCPPPPKKKYISMPPVYILANPIISQILIFVTSHFSYPGYCSLHLIPHLRFFSVPTHVNEVDWGGRVLCNLILRRVSSCLGSPWPKTSRDVADSSRMTRAWCCYLHINASNKRKVSVFLLKATVTWNETVLLLPGICCFLQHLSLL